MFRTDSLANRPLDQHKVEARQHYDFVQKVHDKEALRPLRVDFDRTGRSYVPVHVCFTPKADLRLGSAGSRQLYRRHTLGAARTRRPVVLRRELRDFAAAGVAGAWHRRVLFCQCRSSASALPQKRPNCRASEMTRRATFRRKHLQRTSTLPSRTISSWRVPQIARPGASPLAHDCIRSPDQRLDALPPIFERIDFLAIDEDLETARLQCRFELIGKRHVFARIGDEDTCLRLDTPRRDRVLHEQIA